jgi:ParB family transcriptional regulator, chromosome partitioning protein
MAAEGRRKALGRGLSALLGDDSTDYAELDKVRTTKTVPVEFLHPGRYQPRHTIDDSQIQDLAQSVREKGILQPILVRRHPDEANAFEIIAGERRWRAAQLAQLHEVPVVIKELNDREALEIALVENLQRQDLSPLEEAEGYRRLMDEFEHSQEALGKALGKSRSHVANMMRLLGLPGEVKALLDGGDLTAGHARALLNADKPVALARRVVRRGLNVRQTEALAKGAKEKKKSPPAAEKDTDTLALERDISALLGLRAEIRFRDGKGTLTLHYESLEQLDDILGRLTHAAAANLPDPLDDMPIDRDMDFRSISDDTIGGRNVVELSAASEDPDSIPGDLSSSLSSPDPTAMDDALGWPDDSQT